MKKRVKLAWMILIIITGLSSCYTYEGPVRVNQNVDRIIPPPVEKLVASKLTKAEYLNKAFKEIQGALPEADVTMIEDSIKVLFPNNIIYKRAELYPSLGYETPLKSFSQLLKKYRKTNILITGHTDTKGVESKNKEISGQRANNIKKIITENGINELRLKSWGLGSVSPIAENNTEIGREKNRRVEFVVLYDDK
jgi:outer membrane protein OmpA-like peptidoglycan-associated protein